MLLPGLMLLTGARAYAQLASQPTPEPVPAVTSPAVNVTGLITDSDNAAIAGAHVSLVSGGTRRDQTTDSQGRYVFAQVPPGAYQLHATATGFGEANASVVVQASPAELPALVLQPAEHLSVTAVTQQQQAEIEVHQEEQQRLLGALPNYFVSYNWHAQPLNSRQKFELAWKTSVDPVNTGFNFGVAGFEQARNELSGYGPGVTGYFSRFGAAEGDLLVGTMVGGAILPSLLRQDPRYFYKGTGTVMSRALYALSTAAICRGDNGRWQPNYSGIGGDLAAGAISNLYYPATDRHGATLLLRNGLIDAGMDGVGNLVQEFVFKHATFNWHRTTPGGNAAPAGSGF